MGTKLCEIPFSLTRYNKNCTLDFSLFFLKLHSGPCLPSLVQVGTCFWSGKLQFKVVLSQALIWELSGSWDSPGVQTRISPPRLATEKYSHWTSRWRYDHIVSEGLCRPHQTGTEKENCCDFSPLSPLLSCLPLSLLSPLSLLPSHPLFLSIFSSNSTYYLSFMRQNMHTSHALPCLNYFFFSILYENVSNTFNVPFFKKNLVIIHIVSGFSFLEKVSPGQTTLEFPM